MMNNKHLAIALPFLLILAESSSMAAPPNKENVIVCDKIIVGNTTIITPAGMSTGTVDAINLFARDITTGWSVAFPEKGADGIRQSPKLDLVWTAGYFNGGGGGSTYKWLFGALHGWPVATPESYLLTTDNGYFQLPHPSSYIGQHNDWHLFLFQDEIGGHTFTVGVTDTPMGALLWETPFEYSTTARTMTHIEFRPISYCFTYTNVGVCGDQRYVWMARIVSTGVAYNE